jgi:hypothetical protein
MVLLQAEPEADDIEVPWSKPGNGGRVGTEMDFRFRPTGERWRLLVPEVAFISYARLPRDADLDVYRLHGMERLSDGAVFTDDVLPEFRLDVSDVLGPARPKH